MTITTVDGLEMALARRKVAVQCEGCGGQFGGGYLSSQVGNLRRAAKAVGWKGAMTPTSKDYCPNCSPPESDQETAG